MAGTARLDFAHFHLANLREDLEGTKWTHGEHWTFPSLPDRFTPFAWCVFQWGRRKIRESYKRRNQIVKLPSP